MLQAERQVLCSSLEPEQNSLELSFNVQLSMQLLILLEKCLKSHKCLPSQTSQENQLVQAKNGENIFWLINFTNELYLGILEKYLLWIMFAKLSIIPIPKDR